MNSRAQRFLILSRGCVSSLRRQSGQPDLLPEFITACAAFRGVGKQPCGGIFGAQRAQNIAELVIGETIGFRANQKEVTSGGTEEFEKMAIILLRRYVDINKRDTQRERGAMIQIRFDEFGPFLRDFAGNSGISVAGQVGKDKLGTWFSGPANFEKVDAASASGSGAGTGQ